MKRRGRTLAVCTILAVLGIAGTVLALATWPRIYDRWSACQDLKNIRVVGSTYIIRASYQLSSNTCRVEAVTGDVYDLSWNGTGWDLGAAAPVTQ